MAGDLGALKAKSEPPSQHCGTDMEIWTSKLTENILVKHFGVYEYIFSDKTLLHCRFLTTLNS